MWCSDPEDSPAWVVWPDALIDWTSSQCKPGGMKTHTSLGRQKDRHAWRPMLAKPGQDLKWVTHILEHSVWKYFLFCASLTYKSWTAYNFCVICFFRAVAVCFNLVQLAYNDHSLTGHIQWSLRLKWSLLATLSIVQHKHTNGWCRTLYYFLKVSFLLPLVRQDSLVPQFFF